MNSTMEVESHQNSREAQPWQFLQREHSDLRSRHAIVERMRATVPL